MDLKIQSIALMVIGILLLAFSLLADFIGVGLNLATIGWKQYSGAVLGLVIFLLGAHLAVHHVIEGE